MLPTAASSAPRRQPMTATAHSPQRSGAVERRRGQSESAKPQDGHNVRLEHRLVPPGVARLRRSGSKFSTISHAWGDIDLIPAIVAALLRERTNQVRFVSRGQMSQASDAVACRLHRLRLCNHSQHSHAPNRDPIMAKHRPFSSSSLCVLGALRGSHSSSRFPIPDPLAKKNYLKSGHHLCDK